MCGRYYIDIDDAEMNSIVAEMERNTAVKSGEIFPTDLVPVLAPSGTMTAMHWGFPRYDGKGKIINARSETAMAKNMFRKALTEGRCLIPASWYFEWEHRGSQKVKHALMPFDEHPMWMAGLSKTDPQTGTGLFVILTRPAWSGISFIHDRMPVILPKTHHEEWIYGRDPVSTMNCAINKVHYEQVNADARRQGRL